MPDSLPPRIPSPVKIPKPECLLLSLSAMAALMTPDELKELAKLHACAFSHLALPEEVAALRELHRRVVFRIAGWE
jgi:hypothetical protein